MSGNTEHSTTGTFPVGSRVRVKPGIFHEENLEMEMSGWTGAVTKVERGRYHVKWDDHILYSQPIAFWWYNYQSTSRGGNFLCQDVYWLDEVDLEPDEGEPSPSKKTVLSEGEWLASSSPRSMLGFLRSTGKGSNRKFRLFALACCDRIAHLLTDSRSERAIEMARRYEGGLVGEESLDHALDEADVAMQDAFLKTPAAREGEESLESSRQVRAEFHAACAARAVAFRQAARAAETVAEEAEEAVFFAADEPEDTGFAPTARIAERAAQVAHLFDLFGPLPFHDVPTVEPSVRAWNDGCVVKLAQEIVELDDFTPLQMGVLADALEEAGYTDGSLLGHLRSPGPHGQGCWALDLLLAKE
jgi:hypothetical protein